MRQTRALGILALASLFLFTQPTYAQGADPDPSEVRDALVQTSRLIGAWHIDVASAATPPFIALQTFHLGGTMSETSDLLAQGGEGPGHGSWERTEDGYAVTFELFIFNPDHSPAGRIRVRESITMIDANRFKGFSVADLILPDGTLIENIDNGPIDGTRVSVVKVRPTDLAPPTPSVLGSRRAW